ncbi:MAG: hypothetical protein NVS4B12_07250 [Ktedonobacteraceae bacterium]
MDEQRHFEQNDSCLDRGQLVSLRDGELSTDENVQVLAHLIGCADCSADEREVRKSGQDVYTLLDTLSPSTSAMPNTAKAFVAFQTKISAEQHTSTLRIFPLAGQRAQRFSRPAGKRVRFRWITVAVAAALIAVIILPNAGVLANQFLALFRVQQFQPVRLDANQSVQSLYNNLERFGTVKLANTKITTLSNPTKAQIEQYTHFPLLLPSSLPQGVSDTPRYSLFKGEHGTFTFDAAKARATMQQMGDGNVHIPAQLNGAMYTITIDPGVGIQYVRDCRSNTSKVCGDQNQLDIAEVPSPVVQGSSANALLDLRGFMLSLPHLSTDVHNLWQNVDSSTGTVPLPLPSAQTNAEKVSINGSSAVLLVDSSIKYGGVIWQKSGIVYAVIANTDNRTQIMNTANSLQ